jgi:nucleotidyltransferase/DNA polymerase involved in DNA repair
VVVPPRFDVYREVSKQVQAIFKDYTPLVEPLSLDEAYLDVTDNLKEIPTAWETAKEIRARIYEEIRLTASAGISCKNFLRTSHRTIASQMASSRSCRTKLRPSWRRFRSQSSMA